MTIKWSLHEDGLFLACEADGPRQWIEEALHFLERQPAMTMAPDLMAPDLMVRMRDYLDRVSDYGRVDSYLNAAHDCPTIDLVWEMLDDKGHGLFEEVAKVLEQYGPPWLAFGQDADEDWGWWPVAPLKKGDL
jgi:hypothetical protein